MLKCFLLPIYATKHCSRFRIFRSFCNRMAEIQENQVPTGLSKDETLTLFDQMIASKQNALNVTLKNLETSIQAEFQAKITALRNELGYQAYPAKSEVILNKSIPFTDFSNKLNSRVANAFMSREILHDVCIQIQNHCTKMLTKEDAEKAKKDFDLICNYSKRKSNNIPNTGTLYGKELCLYLMSKTFKKSAVDAYESYFAVSDLVTSETILTKKIINVGSIGGGPGSDLIGTVSYIYDILPAKRKMEPKFNLSVFDIMDQNWKEAAMKPLNWGLYNYINVNEYDKRTEDKVTFSHVDFNKPETINAEALRKLDFITVCWALNEAPCIEEFWTKVFEAAVNAYIIFVEGKEDKTDILETLAKKLGRTVRYFRYENPRKLIILPK